MADDKGFKPTDKRIKEARKKGQILKSPLCSQTAAIIGTLVTGTSYFSLQLETLHGVTLWTLREGFLDLQFTLLQWCRQLPGLLWAPILGAAAFSLCAELLQVGLQINPQLLGPDATRLNPAQGFKKIGRGLLMSWTLALKISCIACLAYFLFKNQPSAIALVVQIENNQCYPLFKNICTVTICTASGVLAAFAAIEYFFKRKKYFTELSMSLDDLRREHKEDEGDPHIKGHRKHLHQSIISQELVKRVRRSKVLIVEKMPR